MYNYYKSLIKIIVNNNLFYITYPFHYIFPYSIYVSSEKGLYTYMFGEVEDQHLQRGLFEPTGNQTRHEKSNSNRKLVARLQRCFVQGLHWTSMIIVPDIRSRTETFHQ